MVVPLESLSRMDPSDMEVYVNSLKQLPPTFLNVQLPLISISRLDVQISTLFARLSILQDQDLVNLVISLLLNTSTSHPDILVSELYQFFGSKTRVFSQVSMWFAVICVEFVEVFGQNRNSADSKWADPDGRSVCGDKASANGIRDRSSLEMGNWAERSHNIKGYGLIPLLFCLEASNKPAALPEGDYKRRRQSYRAKMTHLTKRTTIQEHRDFINMRMQMLAEEEGYRLIGTVDRVTTKTTPQEIEREMRRKRFEREKWFIVEWRPKNCSSGILWMLGMICVESCGNEDESEMFVGKAERRRQWNVCWRSILKITAGFIKPYKIKKEFVKL